LGEGEEERRWRRKVEGGRREGGYSLVKCCCNEKNLTPTLFCRFRRRKATNYVFEVPEQDFLFVSFEFQPLKLEKK
jgi:hypothetical protein